MDERQMRIGLLKISLQYADMLDRQGKLSLLADLTGEAAAAEKVHGEVSRFIAEQSAHFIGFESKSVTREDLENPNSLVLIDSLSVGKGK